MLNKSDPRHEKNRHHLATGIVVLVAAPFFLLSYLALPSSEWIVLVSAVGFAAILAVRTAVIESGMRRRRSAREVKLEHRPR